MLSEQRTVTVVGCGTHPIDKFSSRDICACNTERDQLARLDKKELSQLLRL